jgi:hypothetical protein
MSLLGCSEEWQRPRSSLLSGAYVIAVGSQQRRSVTWGGFRPRAPLAAWRVHQPADDGQLGLIARAGGSKLSPRSSTIIAHRDTEIAKFATRFVEPLFRERDVRVGFRWTMSDPEKVSDRPQGVNPGVKAKLAAGLARHIADRREQRRSVEHGFGG